MIQLYIYLSFGVHPSFKARIIVLFSLSLSLCFSMWILLLLVQVKHKSKLYRFLLSKLEICNGNNEDRNAKHNRITTEMAEYTQILPEIE